MLHYRPVESISWLLVLLVDLEPYLMLYFKPYRGTFMYSSSNLIKSYYFIDFDRWKNYTARKIVIPKLDFQCVDGYFWTNSWCILVNIFWIIKKLEKQLVNDERWRNCKIPISHLSRLEILLKNLDGHFDHVWTATIRLIFKYQMYLCSG